jgi:hypothetical protein
MLIVCGILNAVAQCWHQSPTANVEVQWNVLKTNNAMTVPIIP